MCNKATTYEEWKWKVLLLLTGPGKTFKSGEEAMQNADHGMLKGIWEDNQTQYEAAKTYVVRKSGLVGMSPRLRDLIDRLSEPGPAGALSASEFEELVELVETLQKKAIMQISKEEKGPAEAKEQLRYIG